MFIRAVGRFGTDHVFVLTFNYLTIGFIFLSKHFLLFYWTKRFRRNFYLRYILYEHIFKNIFNLYLNLIIFLNFRNNIAPVLYLILNHLVFFTHKKTYVSNLSVWNKKHKMHIKRLELIRLMLNDELNTVTHAGFGYSVSLIENY